MKKLKEKTLEKIMQAYNIVRRHVGRKLEESSQTYQTAGRKMTVHFTCTILEE